MSKHWLGSIAVLLFQISLFGLVVRKMGLSETLNGMFMSSASGQEGTVFSVLRVSLLLVFPQVRNGHGIVLFLECPH